MCLMYLIILHFIFLKYCKSLLQKYLRSLNLFLNYLFFCLFWKLRVDCNRLSFKALRKNLEWFFVSLKLKKYVCRLQNCRDDWHSIESAKFRDLSRHSLRHGTRDSSVTHGRFSRSFRVIFQFWREVARSQKGTEAETEVCFFRVVGKLRQLAALLKECAPRYVWNIICNRITEVFTVLQHHLYFTKHTQVIQHD